MHPTLKTWNAHCCHMHVLSCIQSGPWGLHVYTGVHATTHVVHTSGEHIRQVLTFRSQTTKMTPQLAVLLPHLAASEAAFFLSLLALAAFSASLSPRASLFGTSGILKAGAAVGTMSVSILRGVPSMVPHVMRGEASTPGGVANQQHLIHSFGGLCDSSSSAQTQI